MTDHPTCLTIIRDHLKAHGYDGLSDGECGCGSDDLAPCCFDIRRCRPAYHWSCEGCSRAADDAEDHCEYAVEGEGCYRTERRA